ncbi:hypothetical protein M2284_003685 [Rhodococcus sp. LBL1]|nr:hypothetical protein [Rhodococcus sp. LBL1]MDH6685398.1 hypothetical protein [Rhodococcus sp. LBL2]
MGRTRRRSGILSSTIAAALAAVLVGGTATAYAAPDPSAPAGDTTCVGSNQATMGAIFDAVLQASKPILPQPFLDNYDEIRAEGHRRLDATGISTLAVSNPAATQSSDPEAGINKYGDPVTRYLVTQLMNVKNGQESAVIRAENLTLGQAVETAYFLIYTTALVPANIIAGMIPSMVSLGPVSAGMLISLPLKLGAKGFALIYDAAQSQLESSCLVWEGSDVIAAAGRPDREVDLGFEAPAFVKQIAAGVSIAGADCPPATELTLANVLARTSDYLRATSLDPDSVRQVEDQQARLAWILEHTMVPVGLIPANPDDFSTIETLLSTALGLVPTVGGATTEALVGLAHDGFAGENLTEVQPLGAVRVGDGLTAAYFAYALTTQVMEIGYTAATDALSAAWIAGSGGAGAAVNPFDWIPSPFPLINAPNTYGLLTYRHVLSSVCVSDDVRPA